MGFLNLPHYSFDYPYYVSPIDYFPPESKRLFEAKLASFDGAIPRTAEPRAGSYRPDVEGTGPGQLVLPRHIPARGDRPEPVGGAGARLHRPPPSQSSRSEPKWRACAWGLYTFEPRESGGSESGLSHGDCRPGAAGPFCYEGMRGGWTVGQVADRYRCPGVLLAARSMERGAARGWRAQRGGHLRRRRCHLDVQRCGRRYLSAESERQVYRRDAETPSFRTARRLNKVYLLRNSASRRLGGEASPSTPPAAGPGPSRRPGRSRRRAPPPARRASPPVRVPHRDIVGQIFAQQAQILKRVRLRARSRWPPSPRSRRRARSTGRPRSSTPAVRQATSSVTFTTAPSLRQASDICKSSVCTPLELAREQARRSSPPRRSLWRRGRSRSRALVELTGRIRRAVRGSPATLRHRFSRRALRAAAPPDPRRRAGPPTRQPDRCAATRFERCRHRLVGERGAGERMLQYLCG